VEWRDDLVERLAELRAREPIGTRQAKWPGLHSQYLKLLTLHGPVVRHWAGPIFTFPDDMTADVHTVSINETNGRLLRGGLTIGWPISATGKRSVVEVTVLFLFVPASASQMRFTKPGWKHSPGTGDEAMPPARSRLGTYRAIPRGAPFLQYVRRKVVQR
jgi:hypothetical protein